MHTEIQTLPGHLHEFVFGDTNYGVSDPDFPSDPPMFPEARVTQGRALGALKSFTYIYDYGDNWQRRVKGENVLPPDPELSSPICLDRPQCLSAEDVGGVPGYIEFLPRSSIPLVRNTNCCSTGVVVVSILLPLTLQDVNERLFGIKF